MNFFLLNFFSSINFIYHFFPIKKKKKKKKKKKEEKKKKTKKDRKREFFMLNQIYQKITNLSML